MDDVEGKPVGPEKKSSVPREERNSRLSVCQSRFTHPAADSCVLRWCAGTSLGGSVSATQRGARTQGRPPEYSGASKARRRLRAASATCASSHCRRYSPASGPTTLQKTSGKPGI